MILAEDRRDCGDQQSYEPISHKELVLAFSATDPRPASAFSCVLLRTDRPAGLLALLAKNVSEARQGLAQAAKTGPGHGQLK